MTINKQNFHEQLKAQRIAIGLSQGELANQLSEEHRVFANVTQSMISLWERGKVTPSILRRVGLAHFFSVNYQYAQSEQQLMKRVKTFERLFEKQSTFFDYPVTSEAVVKYSRLTDYQRDWVHSSHSHILQDTISLDELMKLLNVSDPWVRIFYHQGAIVSAYVYEKSDNKLTIVILSAINLFIWKHVHEYIATLPSNMLFRTPIYETSLSLLFRDLYLEPEVVFEGGAIYETSIGHLYHNTFVRNMLNNDAYDFRLLRYELNKNEEAQILNEAI
ncbi:transcriptional regulator [Vibrio inusitatus NBRC 102082]|uniref:Transcriptional regulator n=1 Tax=Vibrio inusitatus NBRC 102082 TaxID=1219070 RepID=A0A4Y3HY63_9VIBR|nr:helix-turn-helix transcriptional regulator [Vibrio inusitatus]GEA52076.1 transcriptional regulator [Vibrio inusitatus NBRC 102082]